MRNPSPLQPDFWKHIERELASRNEARLLRRPVVTESVSPTEIMRSGARLVSFGANDYLSLAWHPALLAAAQSLDSGRRESSHSAPPIPRFGSGASPLITGYSAEHAALSQAIAEFEGEESAIVFSSGYAANVGTVASLAGPEDLVLSDALNHASLIDGCRLSRATVMVYPHLDTHFLQCKLAEFRHRYRFVWILTDSLFSMDGDMAPLEEIARLCDEHDAMAIIDEAHATGVYGHFGRGACEQHQVTSTRFIRTGTLSKAIGSIGGFVAGPQTLCDWIANFARSWIYSTAMPTSSTRAASAALQLIPEMQTQRLKLRQRSKALRETLAQDGFATCPGDSPIIPIYLSSSEETIRASQSLAISGFYVPAIRPPTSPIPMLRISLCISHTDQQIDALSDALRSGIAQST